MNKFDVSQGEKNLKVIIYSRASFFAKTILAFLALLAIMGLMGAVSRLIGDKEIELVNLGIGLTIFTVVSIFLGRLFLWNTFGKEVLFFEQGHFSRYYDYKLFKSEVESVTYKKLQAKFFIGEEQSTELENLIDDDLVNANWTEGRLELLLNEEPYLSPINLDKGNLLKLVQVINDFNK